YEAALKRLQKLKDYGYICERRVPDRPGGYLPRWISLAQRGFLILRSETLIEPRFTWETAKKRLDIAPSKLAHDVQVVDLWVSFTKAFRNAANVTLKRFSTWPYLYQFESERRRQGGSTLLLPDAFALMAYTDDPALPPIESP